jgi:hypothetical protein
VKEQQPGWQWWKDDKVVELGDRAAPLAAFTVVSSANAFEAGRPESGRVLRIRRRWHNTAQGLPKSPAAEIVDLTVDGKKAELTPKKVPSQAKNALAKIADEYYLTDVSGLAAGEHVAVLKIAPLAGEKGQAIEMTYRFKVGNE